MKLRSCVYPVLLLSASLCGAGEPPRTPPGIGSTAAVSTPSLVESYNHLRAGRWNEAWLGFHAASNQPLTARAAVSPGALHPTGTRLCSELAVADGLARAGHPSESIAILDRLIAAKTDSALPHELKAMILVRTNNLAAAAAILKTAPQVEVGRAHNLILQAYVLFQQGQAKEALALLDAEPEELEECFLAWNLRGCIDAALGNFADALKEFERCLELNPQFTVAHVNSEAVGRARALKLFESVNDNPEMKAKGLVGGTGSASFKASYSPDTGLSMKANFDVKVKYGGIAPGGGVFASSTELLQDSRQASRAAIPTLSATASAKPTAGPALQDIDLEILCPLLIWN